MIHSYIGLHVLELLSINVLLQSIRQADLFHTGLEHSALAHIQVEFANKGQCVAYDCKEHVIDSHPLLYIYIYLCSCGYYFSSCAVLMTIDLQLDGEKLLLLLLSSFQFVKRTLSIVG